MRKRGARKWGIIAGVFLGMTMMSQNVFAEKTELIDVSKDITLRVTMDEVADITNEGTLSDIVIEEKTAGDLTCGKEKDERTIVLSLEDTEYKFTELPKVMLQDGFKSASKVKVDYLTKRGVDDEKIVAITLPYDDDQKEKGKMTISGLKVATASQVEDKILDLKIGRLYEENYSDIKVADILSYGAVLDVDKIYNLKSGDSRSIDIKLKEGMADSLVADREIEFAIDKGFFNIDKDNKLICDGIYVNGKDVTKQAEVDTQADENDKITKFSINVPGFSNDVRDVIEINGLELYAGVNDSGDVTLNVSGRDITEKIEKVIANIETASNITVKKIDAAYNVKDQVGGAVIITEEAKRALELGTIKLDFEGAPYIEYTHLPNVDVTEGNIGIKAVKWSNEGNTLTLQVTKKSTIPSVIVISDFTFDVNGKCPDGKFGVTITGSSIAPEDESAKITFDDFMTVSDKSAANNTNANVTPNTNVNPNTANPNTHTALVTKFKLGSSTYEMNGISNPMDAAAFSQNGRTMVPVRYVAKAAGISDDAIIYKKGIITVKAGKLVTVTVGSRMMTSGTETITMETEPVLANGRTYVPVAEIARALGIKVEWDSATQTAIFTK